MNIYTRLIVIRNAILGWPIMYKINVDMFKTLEDKRLCVKNMKNAVVANNFVDYTGIKREDMRPEILDEMQDK